SAQHLAATCLDGAAVEAGFRLSHETPIEHAPLMEPAHAKRNVNVGVPVATSGFEHQHLRTVILGKPVCKHAARRAGANDDVVVSLLGHVKLAFPGRYGGFTLTRLDQTIRARKDRRRIMLARMRHSSNSD